MKRMLFMATFMACAICFSGLALSGDTNIKSEPAASENVQNIDSNKVQEQVLPAGNAEAYSETQKDEAAPANVDESPVNSESVKKASADTPVNPDETESK